mmetsp:Transcript_27903/g.64842  ORF Transcript_27903/g.64842 Transcript_27903/m.64842 type:complete len:299 (-) Transcript_27903:754-1650(-)
MAHVRLARLWHRVVVAIDDLVQVLRGNLGDPVETLEVVGLSSFSTLGILGHRRCKGWQGDRCQVAHSHFIRRGVLNDLRTEIGRVDGTQVLLVGLAVCCILVEHVWGARLHLCIQNTGPDLLRLDGLPAPASRLKRCVHLLELLTPNIHEALAGLLVIGLVWTEESPVLVFQDPLHEEVRNPEAVEQVPGPLLLLAVVLAELQEVEDVCMPWLEVEREGAFALAAALVNVAGCLVEVAKHGHQAVAASIRAADVGSFGADVGDGHANAAGRLRDECTSLQCLIDPLDAVIHHLEKEAG